MHSQEEMTRKKATAVASADPLYGLFDWLSLGV